MVLLGEESAPGEEGSGRLDRCGFCVELFVVRRCFLLAIGRSVITNRNAQKREEGREKSTECF